MFFQVVGFHALASPLLWRGFYQLPLFHSVVRERLSQHFSKGSKGSFHPNAAKLTHTTRIVA